MLSNVSKRRSDAHITGRKINNQQELVLEYKSNNDQNIVDQFTRKVENVEKQKSQSTRNLHSLIQNKQIIDNVQINYNSSKNKNNPLNNNMLCSRNSINNSQINNNMKSNYNNNINNSTSSDKYSKPNQKLKSKSNSEVKTKSNNLVINSTESSKKNLHSIQKQNNCPNIKEQEENYTENNNMTINSSRSSSRNRNGVQNVNTSKKQKKKNRDKSQEFENQLNQKYYRSPSAPKLNNIFNQQQKIQSQTSNNIRSQKNNVLSNKSSVPYTYINHHHKKSNDTTTNNTFNHSTSKKKNQSVMLGNYNQQKRSKHQKSQSINLTSHKNNGHSYTTSKKPKKLQQQTFEEEKFNLENETPKTNNESNSNNNVQSSTSKKSRKHHKKLSQISGLQSPTQIMNNRSINYSTSKSKKRLKSSDLTSSNKDITKQNSKIMMFQQQDQVKNIEKLIQDNLRKAREKKVLEEKIKENEEQDKITKKMYLEAINNDIRSVNQQKFQKKNNKNPQIQFQNENINLENKEQKQNKDYNKIPWGANQQKLKEKTMSLLNKFYKSSNYEQNHSHKHQYKNEPQDKKCEEMARRDRLGLGFLNDLDEQFIHQIVKKNKEKLKIPESSENNIFQQLNEKTKKKKVNQEQDQENIKLFMEYKKRQIEDQQQQNNMQKQFQKQKKQENLQKLDQNVKQIFKRLSRKSSQQKSHTQQNFYTKQYQQQQQSPYKTQQQLQQNQFQNSQQSTYPGQSQSQQIINQQDGQMTIINNFIEQNNTLQQIPQSEDTNIQQSYGNADIHKILKNKKKSRNLTMQNNNEYKDFEQQFQNQNQNFDQQILGGNQEEEFDFSLLYDEYKKMVNNQQNNNFDDQNPYFMNNQNQMSNSKGLNSKKGKKKCSKSKSFRQNNQRQNSRENVKQQYKDIVQKFNNIISNPPQQNNQNQGQVDYQNNYNNQNKVPQQNNFFEQRVTERMTSEDQISNDDYYEQQQRQLQLNNLDQNIQQEGINRYQQNQEEEQEEIIDKEIQKKQEQELLQAVILSTKSLQNNKNNNNNDQQQQYQVQSNINQLNQLQDNTQQQQEEDAQLKQNQFDYKNIKQNLQQQNYNDNNQDQQEQIQQQNNDSQIFPEDIYDEEELERIAEEIFNNAAICIQKIWRGYYTRKILGYYLEMLQKGQIDNLDSNQPEDNILSSYRDEQNQKQSINSSPQRQRELQSQNIIEYEEVGENKPPLSSNRTPELIDQQYQQQQQGMINNDSMIGKKNVHAVPQNFTQISKQSKSHNQLQLDDSKESKGKSEEVYSIPPDDFPLIDEENKDDQINKLKNIKNIKDNNKIQGDIIDPNLDFEGGNGNGNKYVHISNIRTANVSNQGEEDDEHYLNQQQQENDELPSEQDLEKLKIEEINKWNEIVNQIQTTQQNGEDINQQQVQQILEIIKAKSIENKNKLIHSHHSNSKPHSGNSIAKEQKINKKNKNQTIKTNTSQENNIKQNESSFENSFNHKRKNNLIEFNSTPSHSSSQNIQNSNVFMQFTTQKMSELAKNESEIHSILNLREKAIQMRHKTHMEMIENMLKEKIISPRTSQNKRQELENWLQYEKQDLKKAEKAIERGWTRALDSIQRTQRDYNITQKYQENPKLLNENESITVKSQYSDISESFENFGDEQKKQQNQVQYQKSPSSQQISMTQGGIFSKNKDNKIISHKQNNQDHNLQGSPLNNPQLKLVLESADFDNGSVSSNQNINKNKKSQNSQINMSSSNESLHQQTIDRYANEKLILKQRDSDQSKKSKRYQNDDYSFPLSPESSGNFDSKKLQQKEQNEILKNSSSPKNNELQINTDNNQVNNINIGNMNSPDKNIQLIQNQQKQSPEQMQGDIPNSQEQYDKYQQQFQDQDGDEELDEHQQLMKQQQLQQQQQYNIHQQGQQGRQDPQMVNELIQQFQAEINEKWRMNMMVETRLQEQLKTTSFQDKSDNYGIPSNIFIVIQYLDKLFEYINQNEYYMDEFTRNINTPFGFAPVKRLKLIHGYDSFVDSNTSDSSFEDYNTLPFVLSEDLFIEFEQNIIGNGNDEKQQIIKEFEHIHNKAIFDTFNESLNLFRPYFSLGGPPYAWSNSEKNLVGEPVSEKNFKQVFYKAQKKIIDWAGYLCGIINEQETPKIQTEEEKRQAGSLAAIMENLGAENECFNQVREERLSRMLLTEIFENEYKWQLYEDEKAEVVMELADLVFEELVEEVVDDMTQVQMQSSNMNQQTLSDDNDIDNQQLQLQMQQQQQQQFEDIQEEDEEEIL